MKHMRRYTLEYEFFYERNKNGYQGEKLDRFYGQNHSDIDDLFENIISLMDYYELKKYSYDYEGDIAIGKGIYLFLDVSLEFRSAIEIKIDFSELDENALKKLNKKGYDCNKAEQGVFRRKDYWVFRCCTTCGCEVSYSIDSVLLSADKLLSDLLLEIIKKETLHLIENEEYRKWLKYRIEQPEDVIFYAPIPLQKKRSLLHKLRLGYSYSDCYRFLEERMDTAQKEINNACSVGEDTPDSMYMLREKMRVENNGIREVKECVSKHRTYGDVLDTIKGKYNGEEPDEFADRWNIVEKYDLKDGVYGKLWTKLISEKGEIWNGYCPSDLDKDKTPILQCNCIFVLPAPYESGDIITLDSRPFRKVCHAVVIFKGDNDEVFSPWCLWIQDGKPILDELCKCCDGFESVSPFFKLARFQGELPENEQIIGEVSRWLKSWVKNVDDEEIAYSALLDLKYNTDDWDNRLHEILKTRGKPNEQ